MLKQRLRLKNSNLQQKKKNVVTTEILPIYVENVKDHPYFTETKLFFLSQMYEHRKGTQTHVTT